MRCDAVIKTTLFNITNAKTAKAKRILKGKKKEWVGQETARRLQQAFITPRTKADYLDGAKKWIEEPAVMGTGSGSGS